MQIRQKNTKIKKYKQNIKTKIFHEKFQKFFEISRGKNLFFAFNSMTIIYLLFVRLRLWFASFAFATQIAATN